MSFKSVLKLFGYYYLVVLILAIVLVLFGCSTVHHAFEDYQFATSDPEIVAQATQVGSAVSGLFVTLSSVSPFLTKFSPIFGAMASFLTGLLLGRKKRKG